jgi:CheY-like chemotaxis protein
MSRQQPTTTVAILGANTVVENALAQLLEGEGYSTKVLKSSPLREFLGEEEMPLVGDGVDLVVLVPSLSTRECDAFLAARRRRSTSSPIPVIVLSNPMREAPPLLEGEPAARSVPWPTTAERLAREIEELLLEARFPEHRESYYRNSSSSENSGIPT